MQSNPEKEALAAIQSRASDIRKAADELTLRIKAFEAWLGKLPGRVQAHCVIGSDEKGEHETHLSLVRQGKDWCLVTSEYDARFDHESDSTLLRDASVEMKAWAVSHFPKLLDAIAKRQVSMISQAQEASKGFDEFAKTIGLKEGV